MSRPVLVALLACLSLLPALGRAADWLYLTVPGDTLIGIGQQYLKNPADWPKVQIENKVSDPRRLPANTRIRIPVALLKVTPAPATVVHVEGNVRVKPADGVFRPLAVGEQISGGETVLTGPRSFASFRLADGSTVSQQPSSRLVFGRLAVYGKTGMVATELGLDSGRLEANATPQLPPAGGFRVKTPVAVAGLRGTAFRLNVDEAGKSLRSEVLEGEVGISAGRKQVIVPAGQGSLAQAGRPPAPPRPLLPAPSVIGLPGKVRALPLEFSWQRDERARGWRAQVAQDTAFQKILLEELTSTPAVRWETALPDGRYVLRIRAVDELGLEGLNLDHPFELDVRPLPPQPVAPAEGQRTYQETVELAWSAPEQAHGYLLQIAPTPQFDRDVRERRLGAVTRHTETLPPGTWHWRMASLDEQGERHLWGSPRSLRVQPLPAAPSGGEARIEGDKAHFAWLAVAGADRYQLAIGKGAGFDPPLLQQDSRETKASMALRPGRYVWRVRGVEADGQAGAWSPASPLVVLPETPTALQARLEGSELIVAWQGKAAAWRVELASDQEFKQVVDSRQFTQSGCRLPKPKPGSYWLRVIALGEDGVESAPSRSLEVEVKQAYPWWLLPLLLLPFAG